MQAGTENYTTALNPVRTTGLYEFEIKIYLFDPHREINKCVTHA